MSVSAPPPSLVAAFPAYFRWLLPRLSFLARTFPNWQPTSWFRTPARNFVVGGAPQSQHLLAWAVDWTGPRDEAQRFVAVAQSLGVVAIDEGDHVHVQMYPAGVIPSSFFPLNFSV